MTPDTSRGLPRGLLLLMSTATGMSVASNYLAHPLLDLIGRELGMPPSVVALVVTAAQVGYTLGLMLLVPLGDLVERRRLAVTLYAATAVFLLVSATATSGAALLAGTALAAVTSVGAQVVVPFAATLADPAERGRVVGTVMTGLVLGLMLARTASGALAELGGWRTAYWVNAGLMAVMAVLLRIFLPKLRGETATRTGADGPASGPVAGAADSPVAGAADGQVAGAPDGAVGGSAGRRGGGALTYPALLRSTFGLLRSEPLLRRRAAVAALALASFSVLWTSLTFLLAGPSYGWTESAIGLFGLAAVAGAVAANVAGRLADRGHVHKVTAAGTVLMLASWLPIGLGARSLLWLVIGVIVLDLAQQALLNANQNVVYALRPEARNRVNAAFMTSYFAGGAVGSALAALAWTHAGWTGVSVLGAVLAAGTVALWATERRAAARATALDPRRPAGRGVRGPSAAPR
ncbi:MFS transporter [Nonomuraea indica]|uniref:MFS transporter n=1 Tax=Nonomuraea indica TaxID=1581193 RepID=UPI000C7DB034|nr:MFS transporter [Nonomuraea indica]